MRKKKKKIFSFICIVSILCSNLSYVKANAGTLFQIDLNELNGKLVIIYTNDTHGFLLNDSERSLNAASLVAIKKIFESAGAKVLLLDAGDTIFGTPMFKKNIGSDMVDLINEIGYDAITTGNHDYDYGGEKLLSVTSKLTVPLVVSNLIYTTTQKTAAKRYIIIKKGDIEIGIFGLTTPNEITGLTKYNDTSLTLTDPLIAAKEVSKKLKKEGVDYIIALGHIGMDHRSELSSLDIITEAPDIDLFIDGHSHSSLKLRLIHDNENQTLLVRNLHYFTEIGVVVVDEDGFMHPYTIDKTEVEEIIEKYQ